MNFNSIKSMRFNENVIVIVFKAKETNERVVKKKITDNRIPALFNLNDIKNMLFFTEHGYIVETKDNTFSVINRKNTNIQGHGYDPNPTVAETKAFLEYLERLASTYKLKNTIIDNYANLKEKAINPKVFGLYSDINYKKYNLKQYNDYLEIEWCKGISLISKKEYFVPNQLIQYFSPSINQYVIESSNGSSIGNGKVEAIFYALLEAVERDIFMRFWFGDLKAYKINFDKEKGYYEARRMFLYELGYNVEFYYIQNPLKVPVVWCLITKIDESNLVYSITGLGCHLNLIEAINSSYNEVVNALLTLKQSNQLELNKKISRVEDKGTLSSIMDHVYYFASSKSKTIIEEKLNEIKSVNYSKIKANTFFSISIKEELETLLGRIKNYYTDIIAVDQTNNFINGFSLKCVKVLLVGSIPIDWTSDLIRVNSCKESLQKVTKKNIHPLG